MQDDQFKWDDDTAVENLRYHHVSFEQATFAFNDPFAVEWIDECEAYGTRHEQDFYYRHNAP